MVVQKEGIYDFEVVISRALTVHFIWFVVVSPRLITTLSNITVIEGAIARFHCNATGNPTPNITWIKDGKTVGQGNTLSLTADRNHSGIYWCLAENGLNPTVNDSAYLNVQCKYEQKKTAWNITMKCLGVSYRIFV